MNQSIQTLIRIWFISCPVPVKQRTAFVDGLFGLMEQHIPNATDSSSIDELGTSIADYSYTVGPSHGSVTMGVFASGGALLIAITLQETFS